MGKQMLSIVKSVNEIERLEGMNRAALVSYAEALRAAGEYPVEVVPSETELYRAHIEGLRQRLVSVSEPDGFEIIHTSFRGELRLYRDKSNEWLTSVREELKAAAEAMQTLSIRVAENDSGHEERLKSDLQALRTVIECEDLGRIRTTVQQVAAAIEESYQQLRDANHLLISCAMKSNPCTGRWIARAVRCSRTAPRAHGTGRSSRAGSRNWSGSAKHSSLSFFGF